MKQACRGRMSGIALGGVGAWMMLIVCAAWLGGCAASGNAGDGGRPSTVELAGDQVVYDDPADPVALTLHDLAGRLLMHQTLHHALPATLADLKDGPPPMDPATGRPFVYVPQSLRRPGLPGRVIVHQPVGDAERGRWALLLNDQSQAGHVITYVQRITEQQVPRLP